MISSEETTEKWVKRQRVTRKVPMTIKTLNSALDLSYLDLRQRDGCLGGGLDVDGVAGPADAGVVGAAVGGGGALHEHQVTGVVGRVSGEGRIL